jgi:hypothetical protein
MAPSLFKTGGEMEPTNLEIVATVLFACALLHSFMVKRFQELSHRFPDGSLGENFFHLMGEVEVVFGFWAGLFVLAYQVMEGKQALVHSLESTNFTEPVFVFTIMVVAATKPILNLADLMIRGFGYLLPIRPKATGFYISALSLGPLLGGFITEPAAMTVTALLLKKRFYDRGLSKKFMYSTLGTLFVNVSIGGVLTSFAAPPVIMVATKWGWDMEHMLKFYGWKAVLAVIVNVALVTIINFSELRRVFSAEDKSGTAVEKKHVPYWVMLVHMAFMALIVINAHHMTVFMGAFLFFLGFVTVAKEYNDALKLRESLLVGFFLGGLVVLGQYQSWWIYPLINSLEAKYLYIGTAALTAITDNAALTYLGSQVESITMVSKYALVAGAVVGGGLTVVANAPNPAGYSILNSSFGEDGISPLGLLASAIVPTLIALGFFFLAPGWS